MAKYAVIFRANPSAWPVNPKEAQALLEGVFAGGDALFKSGALKEVGWFGVETGYAMFEAESMEKMLQHVRPFFPMYSHEIHEVVSWERAKQAWITGAKSPSSR